jgi:SAM-dependent methyltransferase
MSGGEFKDHFSHGSEDYRRWRPRYPRELFAWLARESPSTRLAWDNATGNGQAAVGLAEFFDRVAATDASAAQVAAAEPHVRITYEVAPAEASPLDGGSVDLVTVAQALHWFDLERFHSEVRRVLRPGGVLAEWGYGLADIDPRIDVAMRRFADHTVGPYWPPERALIYPGTARAPFPYNRITTPAFAMAAHWDLDRLIAYLGTWSSVNGYRQAIGKDPLPAFREELAPLWGEREREIRWPLLLRVGRHPS